MAAKKLVPDSEINILIKRYSDFSNKRNSYFSRLKNIHLTDVELLNDVNNLINAMKPYESSKFSSLRYEKLFLMMYAHILEIRNKMKFYDIGILNVNGYSIGGNEPIKFNQDKVKQINALLKEYFKINKLNESALEINCYFEESFKKELNLQSKRVLQDIADLYNVLDNYDGAIMFFEEAYEKYQSIKAAASLIRIYTFVDAHLDIDKALNLYDKLLELPYNDDMNIESLKMNKLYGISNIYHYYFNIGDYKNAAYIIQNAISKSQDNMFEVSEGSLLSDLLKRAHDKLNELSEIVVDVGELSSYFNSDVLTVMSDDMKIYIQTSLTVFESIENSKNALDYSAALIPVLKGLEDLIYEIYINGYLNYLKTLNNVNYSKIDSSLYYIKYNQNFLKNRVDDFKIGNAIYSACYVQNNYGALDSSNSYMPIDYFVNFCSEVCNVEDPAFFIINMVKKLEQIKNIRNKAAHRFRITKTDAIECFNILFKRENFISLLYKNFSKIFVK